MKKVLALLLAVVLALSLFACGKTETPEETNTGTTDSTGTTGTPAPSGKAFPNAKADGTLDLDKVAHFDADYDYTQNEKIKVCYIAQAGGPLYQQSADAYEHWAPLYNMEWMGYTSTNNDSDLYLTTLQNMLDQGVRAFILDPDNTIFPAVLEIMNKYPDAAWMSQMSAPRDGDTSPGAPSGGYMINPYVGFNNYDAGWQVSKRCIEWKEETYPDVSWDEVGFICVAYTVSPQLQERVTASEDLWVETTGSNANFFAPDCVSGGFSVQSAIDAVGPVISKNSDIKYWLVNGLIDDFAQGAASVLSQQDLTDTSCVATFGGSGLQMQWDGGQFDSFRYALFTAQNLYAEPIIGGVYAFLQGWATADTIWPSWVKWDDKGDGDHTYPQLRLPTVWLEPETYKHYLEWTDMYASATAYEYSQDGISLSDYSPFVTDVPADYKEQ